MEGARGVRGGTDPTLETAGVAGAGARRVQILKARPPIMKHFADPGPGLPTGVGGGARATGVVLFSHFSESLPLITLVLYYPVGQCHVRGVGAGAGTGGGGAGAKSAPEKELKKLKDEKKLEKNWSPLPVCTLHKFWLLSVTIKKINPIKKRFLGCLNHSFTLGTFQML